VEQALAQQTGTKNNIEINVENLPQFQEEWRKVSSQIDNQYSNYLNEYKQNLREIV
jgi:mRNA-degrading endonuclease RelE of RelBE toxin-antitoxin system